MVTAYDLAVPLCEELRLDPNLVRRITLTPMLLEAEVFLLNAEGEKYVDPMTDRPATVTRTIPIHPGESDQW
jgi:hypothetical protein